MASKWENSSQGRNIRWAGTKYHAHLSINYVPASLDSILQDRGVKEPDERKIATATIVKFKQNSRTMSWVASFLDMIEAAAGRMINEAMEEESLFQWAKDALQGVANLEQSRGHAAFHLLLLAST